MHFKNIVGLVTGGASGLGKATVQHFIKQGNKVALIDLPSSKGAEIASELGEDVKFFPADVYNEEEVQNALISTKKAFGKLNMVVNCAGVSVAFKTFNFNSQHGHHLNDFERVLKVNTIGTFNVCRLAAPFLYENALDEDNLRGLVINTSAFAAYDGQEGQVAFSTSKAAIAGMTLPMARDFSSAGIRVCCIAPGLFDTPLLSILPDKVKTFFSRMAISPQRLGKPEEYAKLVQSIAENPFLNAEVIRLDGGLRMI